MSEYTPTTEEVRRCYGDIHCSDLDAGSLEHHECPEEVEFDRWLAEVERAAAARALEEFAEKWATQDGIEALMFAKDDVSAIALTEKSLRARAAEIREVK